MIYKEEAIKFWDWFLINNVKIKKLIDDNDIGSVNDFLLNEIVKVIDNVSFEISKENKKYKLELMCMANQLSRIFILSLLVYAPVDRLKEWEFFGFRTAKKGSLAISNITLCGEDIRLFPKFYKKIGKFKIKVMCEKLNGLKEQERVSAMYLLLYEYIGEILTESLIGEVEFISKFSYKIRYKNQSSCQLNEFRRYLNATLGSDKILEAEKNSLISEYFKGKPLTSEIGNRKDILQGHSGLIDINYEVYSNEKPITEYLKSKGVIPMYLEIKSVDKNIIKDVANKLNGYISSNGFMIGSSVASQCTYLDFLWLDDISRVNFSSLKNYKGIYDVKFF